MTEKAKQKKPQRQIRAGGHLLYIWVTDEEFARLSREAGHAVRSVTSFARFALIDWMRTHPDIVKADISVGQWQQQPVNIDTEEEACEP